MTTSRILALTAVFVFCAVFIAGASLAITLKGETGGFLLVTGVLGACFSASGSALTFD